MVQKNAIYPLTVTEQNSLGFGVARYEGQVIFVSGALQGEEVLARVLKVTKSYAVAKAETIKKLSPHRIQQKCSVSGCGGCVYGTTAYEEELRIKKEGVKASFIRHGLDFAMVEDVVSAGKAEHYRNKTQYPVAQNKDGSCRIGFYAPHTHRVVEAENCLLQPKEFAKVLKIIRGFVDNHRISIYNEATRQGLLRHIYLRKSEENGEILVVLVLNGNTLPYENNLVDGLRTSDVPIAGLMLCENREDTNVVLGNTYRLIWGKGYIEDTLAGVKLRLTPPSFYQVNHAAAEKLYAIAAEKACLKANEVLLDLFCGVGSIGLSMAKSVKEVIGVEIVEDAVVCAKENAEACGIQNACFYCADATNAQSVLALAERERGASISPDIVVLDPPRKGCDTALLSYIAELSPAKILYISCNPDTLARDTALLLQKGYQMGVVTPVNLFPRTAHVEAVVLLTKIS